MAKHKKTKKLHRPLLVTTIGFLVLIGLSTLLTYKQLHNPKSAFAATCDHTIAVNQLESYVNGSSVSSGQTVCVNAGEYRGNIVIRKSGVNLVSNPANPARIIGQPTGGSNPAYTAAFEINTSNTTVSGFDVSGPAIRNGLADTGSNNKLIGNHVHDVALNNPCAGGDDWGGAGILMENGDHTTVTGNLVENIASGQNCEYVQGIYSTQPSATITNNIVKNVDAFCIHLWHGAKTNYKIYNNVVDHCGVASGTSGITIGADPNEGGQVTNSTIANNIVMNSNRGIEENNASNNFYYNNINYNVSRDQLAVSCSSTRCTGNSTVNPQLDSNYRPMAGSPVINAGYSSGAPTTDYEGKNRVGVPDIGAYEFGSSTLPPTNTPVQQPTATPRPNTTSTPTPRPTASSTPRPSSTPTPRPTNTQPQPTNPPPGGPTSLGNTQLANPVRLDNTNSNKLHGIQIRPAQNTTVNSGFVYIGNIQSGTNVGLAIYSNTTTNTPGNLIVQSGTKAITTGWNYIPLLATPLSANTPYWLVTNNNGSSTTVDNLSFTSLPSGTGCTYTTGNYNYSGTFPSSITGLPLTSCSMYFSMYVASQNNPLPTTTVPSPTTQPGSTVTVSFDGAPLGALRGITYPLDGSINWQGESWLISPAWGLFSTRNLSFRNSDTSQGTLAFTTPALLKTVEAYNGGTNSSSITIICGSQTATATVGAKIRTTITTGFTTTCQTVTFKSTNGWDTNFDNLVMSH